MHNYACISTADPETSQSCFLRVVTKSLDEATCMSVYISRYAHTTYVRMLCATPGTCTYIPYRIPSRCFHVTTNVVYLDLAAAGAAPSPVVGL